MKLSVFQSLHESYFSLQTAHVKVWWQGRDQQVLGEFVRRFRMYIWNQKMLILPLWGPLLEKFLRIRCSIIGEGWGFFLWKERMPNEMMGRDEHFWVISYASMNTCFPNWMITFIYFVIPTDGFSIYACRAGNDSKILIFLKILHFSA